MVRSDFHGVHGILQKLKWILFFITGMRQKPTSKSVNGTILKPTDRKFNFYYLLLINNSIYCGLYKNLIYFKLIHARIIHIWNANANNSHWEPTYAATIGKNAGNINEMNFGSYWSELKWATIVGSWAWFSIWHALQPSNFSTGSALLSIELSENRHNKISFAFIPNNNGIS